MPDPIFTGDYSADPKNTNTEQELAADLDVSPYGAIRVEMQVDFDGNPDLEVYSHSAPESGGTYKRDYVAGSHATKPGFRTYKKNGHHFEGSEVGSGDQWISFVLLTSGANYVKFSALGTGGVLVKQILIYGGHA